MMALEAGGDILFHVYFSDVILEGNRVTGVVFEGKSGRQAAKASVVIDASGDGDVSALKVNLSFAAMSLKAVRVRNTKTRATLARTLSAPTSSGFCRTSSWA